MGKKKAEGEERATERIELRVTPSLLRELRQHAARSGVTVALFLRMAAQHLANTLEADRKRQGQ